jgi:hypothetical protein
MKLVRLICSNTKLKRRLFASWLWADQAHLGGDMDDEIDMLLQCIRLLKEDDDSQMIGLGEIAAADGSAGSWSSWDGLGVPGLCATKGLGSRIILRST